MSMTTRDALHALVEDLEETEWDLAKQALQEIRGDAFDLTETEERELLEREAECDRGEKIGARDFFAELRREERTDSNH